MAPNAALSFSRPEALLLLLLLVPLAIYLSRAGLALVRRGRKRLSLGLRIALITLLVLVALRPDMGFSQPGKKYWVYFRDKGPAARGCSSPACSGS